MIRLHRARPIPVPGYFRGCVESLEDDKHAICVALVKADAVVANDELSQVTDKAQQTRLKRVGVSVAAVLTRMVHFEMKCPLHAPI
jgi:hypothetical protein